MCVLEDGHPHNNLRRALVLRDGKDDMPESQTLRAGLYLFGDISRDVVYVIFWPQDTTWHDDCISSVARNRVTFMRFVFFRKCTQPNLTIRVIPDI